MAGAAPVRDTRVPAICLALGLAAPGVASAQAAPPPITIGSVTISGFVQADAVLAPGADAEAGEPPATFAVPRARVGRGGALTPKITWYLQGEFANLANDGRVLRDAYVQFTATPQIAVRAGQMVAPYSLERLTSYAKLELIDRSVAATALVPSRDVGLMVFNVEPWRGWLTYQAAMINGTGQNRVDDNSAKDVVGRVAARVPRVAGYELAARYVNVEDDADALDAHSVQAGGTYFVSPQVRVQSNLVVPIGDDQPRHSVRWWSRVQLHF